MGNRFRHWQARSTKNPACYEDITKTVWHNRQFSPVQKLSYGDHGLEAALDAMVTAIRENRRIALYADYDVDGTMSCVSWIWFFESIGFENFVHYIPDRFREGYGVNLEAVKYLAETEEAQVILTMDTGITANTEAAWCKEHGITFICTDHHKVQPEKMPDCLILNPKNHPAPSYQELCGCGITFVLLRKLGDIFMPPPGVWNDILAITGMATICDVVPLNGVNHRLAQHGVQALVRSQRPVLKKLLHAASVNAGEMDERDIGFRLGPRINAVGRLGHASLVVEAFIGNNPDPLIHHMGICNEKRKTIQNDIVREARALAEKQADSPVLFLGGDWHQGVVGIAASKLAEEFWKPVWLFQRKEGSCKGSARSVPGFDVTDAMTSAGEYFNKFGGHSAAGGFSFDSDKEQCIHTALKLFATDKKSQNPGLWESRIDYDCELPPDMLSLPLTDCLDQLRPFGHCFEEPVFRLRAVVTSVTFYKDKKTGFPRHTAVSINNSGRQYKVMFFNEVIEGLKSGKGAEFLITVARNHWQGRVSLSLMGKDYSMLH